jgi:hypothetical protein
MSSWSCTGKTPFLDRYRGRAELLMYLCRRLQNPVRTANAFGVEEIIDPADTRHLLCTWVRHVYEVLMPIRLAERANGRIAPMYY